ncbi:nucleoporin p58/p45-like [Montipora foliosa]|uniref:nucleoporin p58/p45-like n=1 Tax=Montipora foliosa TaxID=591990 RepID=UPI0035F21934
MAAATTGGLFGGGSTGFPFGTGTTSVSIGTSNFGASTSGIGTLGTTAFSAIKPFGVATTTATPSIPFGQTATTTTAGNSAFSFGVPGSTAAKGLTGLIAPKTTSAVPTLGVFGQTSQAGQSTVFNLGGTAGTTAATGLTPGIGLFKTNTAATTTTTLLGSTVTSTGLGLAGPGLGVLGSFGGPKTTASTSGTALTGLGGTGSSTGGVATGAVAGVPGRQGDVKDSPLPNPLNEIAEHIKKYVKEQKEHKDEISRVSGSALDKVREETIALRQALALVSNSIQRDGCAVENLKMDVSQELKNAEIAQRTNDIPQALQHENIAPQEYFQRLVESFEERMQIYRKQIEITESHLASLSQGQTLTPQDLSHVLHKVHETFIALAAQLHEIHEAVKVQKEQYLNYRRAYFKDSTDVFASSSKDLSKTSAEFSLGPSPFRMLSSNSFSATTGTNLAGPQALGLGTLQAHPVGMVRSLGAVGTSSLGTSFGTTSGLGGTGLTTGSAFGTPLGTSTLGTTGLGATGFGTNTGFGTPSLGSTPGGAFGSGGTGLGGTALGSGVSAFSAQPKFQLQRPPAGNKRGKRR